MEIEPHTVHSDCNMAIYTTGTTNSNGQNKVICIAQKRVKDCTTRCVLRVVNESKCGFGRGSTLDPAGGAYSAPQTRPQFGEGCRGNGKDRMGKGKGTEWGKGQKKERERE